MSAIADIGVGWVLRRQCGGLLTVVASSSWTAASRVSELTLPTHYGHTGFSRADARRHEINDGVLQLRAPDGH